MFTHHILLYILFSITFVCYETESMYCTPLNTSSLHVRVRQKQFYVLNSKEYSFIGNDTGSFAGVTPVPEVLHRIGSGPITMDLNRLRSDRYFVIPNVKGLCNRLQLFAGLFILSSYHRIPIIRIPFSISSLVVSSSMKWHVMWDLQESFPGQFVILPDPGGCSDCT